MPAPGQPLADRQAAADAFRVAVQKHGLLLTRAQLQTQYDLYNTSEQLDRDTQKVLSDILDAMEGPSRKTDANNRDR